jgi:hypothetical protein
LGWYWEGTCGVKSGFVAPGNTFWEAFRESDAHVFFASGGGEHERGFEVVVAADHFGFVAAVNEEFLGLNQRWFVP